MTSHLSNPWNNAVALLTMHFEQQILSTGSCFFWLHDGKTLLVTNWHNLAGRNPLTNQPMSSTLAIPDRVVFMVYRSVSEPDSQGFYELEYIPLEVTLNDAETLRSRWYEHPIFGRRVDVAVIEVTDVVQGCNIEHVNILESNAMPNVSASHDVFVIGFPFGQIANAPAPIWKRGSIALDPTFNPEGLPKILIDTATREGMSGSVAVARQQVLGSTYEKKDGSLSEPVIFAKHDVVLGVYSGRHYPDLEKAQLGIVWKRNVIEEIVAAAKRADA